MSGKLFESVPMLVVLTVAFFAMGGCASQEKKPEADLEAQIRAEPPAPSPEAIAERGAQAFINSPALSQSQKQKIMMIYIRTFNEAIEIRNEIGQAKSLLFKTVATSRLKSKEVEALKKRIVELDHRRLEVMFASLQEIQDIVGVGPEREEIWKHFYDFEYPRGGDRLNR